MKIIPICPKSFASNTYLLLSQNEAFVVDPSVSTDAICKMLKEYNATLSGILLTHGHFDHIVSIDTLRERLNIPVYVHNDDACMLTDGRLNGFYTFFERDCVHDPADKFLKDGDTILIGNESLSVIHTPGHSKGSCCFLFNENDVGDALITGDTLFAHSVGRWDLYGGDRKELLQSIKRLSAFDKNAPIYPGHDTSSTLGDALNAIKYYFEF